jgi:hypothetical protein
VTITRTLCCFFRYEIERSQHKFPFRQDSQL